MSEKKITRKKVLDPNFDFNKMKSVHSIHSFYFIAGLAFILFAVNISKIILLDVPDLRDSDLPFVASQAWKDLKVLNDYGPKVTGTHVNEVLVVNFLKKRITEIQSKANKNQSVLMDHQIVSGSYYLGFRPYGMVTVYRNVQNIVVRLEGDSRNALMINCHFDSVAGSPGAGDDSANCVIMLELLQITSQRPLRNRHSIIFVFNGAEETGLRASHGFITQHKWAKDIKVFINLEAAGSGGKETLFQSDSQHSWLLNHYKAVSRPFANSVSEEIFQSGLIPSDTDFRIFRDFGKIPGLDFAHVTKGYRYHTKYDSIDYLTQGVLQRTGENMLNLVLSLTNSVEMDNVNLHASNSSSVYFDILGLVFVHYSKEAGSFINFIVVICSIVIPFLTLTKATVIHSRRILSETLLGFISIICGSGFSGLVCFLTAYGLDRMDRSMSWYRNTLLAPGIYSTATLLSLIFVYDVIDATLGVKNLPLSLGLKVQARLDGVNVFWGVITLGVTVIGLRAGSIFMIMLLTTLICNIIIFCLGLHNSVHRWLYVHLAGQFFIVLWTSYLYHIIIDFFVPITGRSGSSRNPDSIISAISCATTLFICSYYIPLTQLLRTSATKYISLISIFLISILLAISTHWGFPYQNEDIHHNPTIQRHHVAHTIRYFFDEHGALRHSDAGFYFMEWDRHSRKTIESVSIPDLPVPISKMCGNEILCGLPLISSRTLLLGGQWLPASTPKFPDAAIINSHSKIILSDNKVKYTFSCNETSLSAIFIRLRGTAKLLAWSFSEEIPHAFNNTYFVSVGNGIVTEPLSFDVTLKIDGDTLDKPFLDITMISIRFDRKNDYTNHFKNILNRFPDWTFAVDCISAVTGYTF